jgi:hypothetical protein
MSEENVVEFDRSIVCLFIRVVSSKCSADVVRNVGLLLLVTGHKSRFTCANSCVSHAISTQTSPCSKEKGSELFHRSFAPVNNSRQPSLILSVIYPDGSLTNITSRFLLNA